MRERILENIRHECRKFLRDATPMPARDARWTQEIERIMAEELKIFENEQKQQIEEMYANFHKKHVSGISYEEWLEKAKKLYTISGAFVTSIARGPSHPETFGPFKTDKACHKKVLQLIYYKQHDHYERGCDFAYDPEAE